MKSKVFGDELKSLYPVVEPNLSDSGCVDCVLEWLVMAGDRSLPEVTIQILGAENPIKLVLKIQEVIENPNVILFLFC